MRVPYASAKPKVGRADGSVVIRIPMSLKKRGGRKEIIVPDGLPGYSSGVASLVEAFQLAKQKESSFSLVAVSPAAMRVLALARLDRVFTIHESLEDGLEA